jgi:hypothetical protein
MTKAKIIVELESIVMARLFGPGTWLADRETLIAVERKITRLGLIERLSGDPPSWQFSHLGKELNLDLFYVFMGLFDEWEVPMILENYRLIDESEADAIYERMSSAGPESVLSGYVKRAYFDYWKANKFLH